MNKAWDADVAFAPELLELLADPEARKVYEKERVILGFARELQGVMEAQGVTRAELARRTGRSPQAISRALTGHQNLTVGTMVDLAFAFGHTLDLGIKPLKPLRATKSLGEPFRPLPPLD